MIPLDMRTLVFLSFIIDVVCFSVMLSLWRENRNHFHGIGYWLGDFFLQTLTMLGVTLRGHVSDWISIVIGISLSVVGAFLGLLGLEHFFGSKGTHWHNKILLFIFPWIHAYFTFVRPNVAIRNLNFNITLLILCFQCAWMLRFRIDPVMRRLSSNVAMVFVGFCVVSLVRIGESILIPPQSNDFMQSGFFTGLLFISYPVLLMYLVYGLFLLVNKRLVLEIHTEREKFEKAFLSAPYALILTRLSDGKVLEVNQGFSAISGYLPEEVIGRSTYDLALWTNIDDREWMVSTLSSQEQITGKELKFRKKSGELVIGLLSATLLKIHDETCILASVADITELKRAEEEIRVLAITDILTGLYNRRGFLTLAEQQIKIANRTQKGFCLFFIDLDGMKGINDRLGHDRGDEALMEAASVLRSVFRESDILARIGGDEFAVLALDTYADRSTEFVDRLYKRITEVNTENGRDYRLSMSIGPAYYDPHHPIGLEELMSNADKMMYQHKMSRRKKDNPV